jgi:hypothetical protein
MKVLSRKPAPRTIAKKDPVAGIAQLALEDDNDEGEEEEADKIPLTAEEIRMRQQKEREEKQRRYDEARAKIFGDSNPPSTSSTPGSVTPPNGSEGRQNPRVKGRGRGGGNRPENRQDNQGRQSHTGQSGARELYDPNYVPKPGFKLQKRDRDNGSPVRQTTPAEDRQAIRAPRGPDGSGRGGFGFARQGANDG